MTKPWIWYWSGDWGYGFRPARFNPCHLLIEAAGLSCAEAEASAQAVDLAIGGYTGRPSSFAVLDELIRQELARLGESLEYVCFRPALPDNPEPGRWTIPVGCEGYDDWALGLSASTQAEDAGVPLAAARQHAIDRHALGDASLRTALAYNFAAQDIHILQSVRDDVVGPGRTCGPFQQGCSRLERMQLFRESLLIDLPDALHEAMVTVVRNCRVIDAAHPHSSASMFADPTVREIIFGPG